MSRDLPAALRDQKEKQNSFAEVVNAERLLWASIQSEGILHPNIQDLYHKARTAYENIILNNNEVELQEVEYSLWKLHYKHIDEFRKRIKKASTNAESNNINSHLEGFKLFLSEATEFYNDLISKFRKCCGLPEDSFLYKKGQRCNYASHRFLVCLGDLSRYKELCKKPDAQKWAVAATYYLEATMVWPDSGNPQNQLALLATYVGDDFLALYHCVRSLAVKEPFPDARDNIMLLFEKNRSSQLHSLSSKSDFDFSKPFKRSSLLTKSHSSCDSTNSDKLEAVECGSYGKTESWHLFVRMISFFLVKSSLEDFPHTFASTMSEFEALLALDDTKLNSTLELYDQMDSARKGPYRALQVVSIIIFIIHNLAESPEPTDPKEKQLSAWTQWGWTCTFTFLGRFLERCVGNNHPECSPLLPAVLVFVEWFVGVLDYTEAADEKVSTARSYFFGAFVDLLNQLDFLEDEVKSVDQIALWEDYELRGFGPIAHSHQSLDFSTHWSKYEGGNKRRTHRIFLAAMKIVNRSNGSQKWIFYDQLARKFHASDSTNEKDIPGMNGAMEEEEEIVFKPLMRYNSAPIHTCVTTSDQISLQGISNQKTGTSDESLRRAASLFVEQNEDLINLHTDTSNFRYKQRDPLQTGPPSLSGWVLNKESSNIEREKGTRNLSKPELIPIQEIPYMPLANLSISPCLAPIPSAPLLPEDPIWLRGNFPESKTSPALGMIKEGHSILSALPLSRFSNFSPPRERVIPSFIDAFPQPPVLGMSSSEWLYHYNLERGNISNHSPGNLGNYLHGYDGSSRFDVFDRWGNPLATNRTGYLEKPNLHMGSPLVYGCGVGANAEQPQHLQYLKEREWQLQSEPPLRGPTYMGN